MTTEQVAGTTVTTDLDSGETTTSVQPAQPSGTKKMLNPVTQRVIERAIQEVLGDYAKQTKQFTADSMHAIRVKVTEMVKQRLGEGEITSVDIGLDLTNAGDIPFFFKVNIPTEKGPDHLLDVTDEQPPQVAEEQPPVHYGEASTVEEFKKIMNDMDNGK